jgi:hypothetical protein
MSTIRRLLLVGLVGGVMVAPAATQAAPLPDNCTKTQGTVSCTEGPGKNQGGVGTTDETQGNTTNKSPAESQDLDCTKKPPKSQGGAIGDCPA